MRRITGISGLKRGEHSTDQEVLIKEAVGWVTLHIEYPSYGAKMTPQEAEFLGLLLTEAAKRAAQGDLRSGPPAPEASEQ